jgi:hypothetical protein
MLGGLSFEIDVEEIKALQAQLGATEELVGKATSRALKRTAATIRKQSSMQLRPLLGLRNAKVLRKRLREVKTGRGARGSREDIRVWLGMNDMPVSAFKGQPRKTGTGAAIKGHDFADAFIGKKKEGDGVGRRTIFKRAGEKHLPVREQSLPVANQMMGFVEDQILPDVGEIFMKHFRADLRARVIHGVGAD